MNILYLKYAAEVAKAGSINRAAEELYVAQPNLSRAIKELEKELGITIFERTSRGMIPTPEGRLLLERARSVLEQIDDIENMFAPDGGKRHIISLSAPHSSYISRALASFAERFGEGESFELRLEETDARKTIKNVIHGDSGLGILRFSAPEEPYFKAILDKNDLIYERIAELPRTLIMSRRSPLADAPEITRSALETLTEVVMPDASSIELAPSDARTSPELFGKTRTLGKRIFVGDRASFFDMLETLRNAYALSEPLTHDLLAKYELVARPLADGDEFFRDLLIYDADRQPSRLERELCAELRKKATIND